MKSTPRPGMSPMLVLVMGIFAVSTSALFIRLAQVEANSIVVAAYRLSFASIILLPFAWHKRAEFRRLRRGQVGLILLSGAFLALHFATWISSLAYTSVASSVVLVTTTPLWVGMFSPVFLRERLSLQVWLGLLVALAGGVLVGLSEACQLGAAGLVCPAAASFIQGKAFLGNSLALIGAFLAAGYMIVGRRVRAELSLVSYISLVYGTAAVLLVGMALASGQRVSGFSLPVYFWMFCLAVIPQLLGHTSYNFALGYLPAAFVSVSVLAEPVGATLLAIVVLGELPTQLELIGGVIILAGIGLATWKKS